MLYSLFWSGNMGSSHKARLLYSPQKLGKNNTKKAQNAVKDFGKLLARFKKEGATKWMQNAIMTAKARLNKFGFNDAKLKEMYDFDAKDVRVAAPKKAKPAVKKAAPKKEMAEGEEAPKEEKKPTAARKAPAKKAAATTAKKKPAAKKE